MTAKYLIIAGTTKAATTSLYNYLGDHNSICKSKIKETRYFLDQDYPVRPGPLHVAKSDNYDKLFDCDLSANSWLVEATPDYLYGDNTPLWIDKTLDHVKLVFILRDPVERLKSWYKFAKQNGSLDSKIQFRSFIEKQDSASNKQYLRALDQGRYSYYLGKYLKVFDSSQILVLFYENLKNDPFAEMNKVCDFIDIDSSFYNDYDFAILNKSQVLKYPILNAYYKDLKQMRKKLIAFPFIHDILRSLKRLILDPTMEKINNSSEDQSNASIDSSTLAELGEYYQTSNDTLKKMLGIEDIPWN